MYHKAKKLFEKSYYDTIEEMPSTAKIEFPEGAEKECSIEQMMQLSNDGWKTVMHSWNGACDHWVSVPLATWVKERFCKIIRYVDKNGKTVGYNRASWSAKLTKENVWHAEVTNS